MIYLPIGLFIDINNANYWLAKGIPREIVEEACGFKDGARVAGKRCEKKVQESVDREESLWK